MSLVIELGGEELELVGDRAVWWPRQRSLLLADVHLGKAETLRRHGIALPHGSTAHELARLDRLLTRWPAGRLWVLGDLVHGPTPTGAGWRRTLAAWLSARPGLELVVVRGNHDRHLPPEQLGIRSVAEPHLEQGLWLAHEPNALPGPGLCGHLHPVWSLREGRLRERVPVFFWRDQRLVLPAWGALTGGVAPTLEPGDRLFAALDDGAVELPAQARRGGPRTRHRPPASPASDSTSSARAGTRVAARETDS